MTSFLIPIIYNVPLSATSIKFSALSSNKRSFHWNKLKSGNRETIAEFSPNYIVPQKFVEDYVDHLAQIEMCKKKQSAESERQQIQQLEQDYNEIEWEQYCIFDQILSLKVHELNVYLVRQRIVF